MKDYCTCPRHGSLSTKRKKVRGTFTYPRVSLVQSDAGLTSRPLLGPLAMDSVCPSNSSSRDGCEKKELDQKKAPHALFRIIGFPPRAESSFTWIAMCSMPGPMSAGRGSMAGAQLYQPVGGVIWLNQPAMRPATTIGTFVHLEPMMCALATHTEPCLLTFVDTHYYPWSEKSLRASISARSPHPAPIFYLPGY